MEILLVNVLIKSCCKIKIIEQLLFSCLIHGKNACQRVSQHVEVGNCSVSCQFKACLPRHLFSQILHPKIIYKNSIFVAYHRSSRPQGSLELGWRADGWPVSRNRDVQHWQEVEGWSGVICPPTLGGLVTVKAFSRNDLSSKKNWNI